MTTFIAGTTVTRLIQLANTDGPIVASSVEATVTDAAGATLVDRFAVVPVDGYVSVVTSVAVNSLQDGVVRDGRVVTLYCTTEAGKVVVLDSYTIEREVVLSVPSNSFVTLLQGEILALSLTGVNAWIEATPTERVAALSEAYLALCRLKFTPFKRGNRSQDRLYSTDNQDYSIYSNIQLLSASEFESLPNDFKQSLARAQLVEASVLLDGSKGSGSNDGLVSETVGEVKQTFRQSMPLDLPVSRRALKQLTGFVTFVGIIAR